MSYIKIGPCPMHEVVLMAVSAAVIIEMANCITVFQKFLFFIVSKVLRLIIIGA